MTWLKRFFIAVCVVIIGATAVANYLPTDTEVTSNLPDQFPTSPTIPAGARQLDPSKARPGLIATTTTAPVYGPENPNDFIVIDQGHTYRVSRTPLTSQLLWLATKGQ